MRDICHEDRLVVHRSTEVERAWNGICFAIDFGHRQAAVVPERREANDALSLMTDHNRTLSNKQNPIATDSAVGVIHSPETA